MTPQLFPINFDTEAGRQFLQRVGERHGPALVAAVRLPSRLFGLASPLAPGLCFAGGEAALSCYGSDVQTSMNAGGTGLTLEDAVASCLGETVERLSQAERQGDVTMRLPVIAVRAALGPDCAELIADVANGNALRPDEPVDWVAARDLCSGRDRLIPADWCLRRAIDGPLRLPDTPLSIGVAAGPTLEAASSNAILEVLERDAVAQWWIGGRRGRALSLEVLGAAGAPELIGHVRQGQRSRTSWLIDITTDVPVPTVVAVSAAPDGKGFACGMAARMTVRDAIRAAVFEMCQMELALLVVQLKRQQRGDDALNMADRGHLARATGIDALHCPLLHPLGVARSFEDRADGSIFPHIQRVISEANLEVALVNLTRPDYSIPVCAAIAPALQRFPSATRTKRLKQAIAETGGGHQWTGGIALA